MIGETVGNFNIVARLGQGGMGEVYLGEQKSIKTKVAIKALLPHISANTEHVKRFFNEAIAVSRIKHSGIAKIFDVGFLTSGRAYLVMEFLEGETLASRIRRAGRLTIGQVGDVGRQIANVLEATHDAGITHRDLKPDNIFLVPDAELDSKERVKILDFGIAKLGGTGVTGTSVGSMGTPGYMAPEQWHNSKAVDWRADAYSLGCVAFEMATGRVPFPAESIAEACTKHLTATPQRLRELVPSLPAALETLVARLLEKEPANRPATMKEVTQTFAAIGAGQPKLLDATIAPGVQSAQSIALAATIAPAPKPTRPPQTTLGSASGAVAAAPPPRSNKGLVIALSALGVLFAGLVIALVAYLQGRGGEDKPMPRDEAKAPAPPPTTVVAIAPPAPPNAPSVASPAPDAAAAIVALSPPVKKSSVAVAAQKPGRPSPLPTPTPIPKPTPSPTPTPSSGNCDEVSCVLTDYEGACCAKFKKQKTPAPSHGQDDMPHAPASDLPDGLDRGMISAGIAPIKARAMACGDKAPGVKGTVKVHVKVASDGQVISASVTQTPDDALGACVAAAVSRASFAKTQRGGSFSFPFPF